MTDVVAIAFTPASPSDSPNLKASTDNQVLTTFHNLIELSLASVRRWNPTTKLVLVTTSDPGPRLHERFDALGVSILETEFAHRPPKGFYPSFNASLFSIDAMSALAARYSADDRIVLLDPDIICTKSIDALFAGIPPSGFLAYDTEFPAHEVSQGLSAVEASRLHQQLDPALVSIPRHYGGELYGFHAPSWDDIASRVDDAWSFSLAQWRRGLPRFVTEEHLLNYALRHTQIHSANYFVRRIWTAPTYRTVRPQDRALSIWHLPAEKHRGLARMHPSVGDAASWFWTESQANWGRTASRYCGLSQRTPARWARDHIGASARRLQMIVRGSPSST